MKLKQLLLLIAGTSAILFILIIVTSNHLDVRPDSESELTIINYQEIRELNETLNLLYKELRAKKSFTVTSPMKSPNEDENTKNNLSIPVQAGYPKVELSSNAVPESQQNIEIDTVRSQSASNRPGKNVDIQAEPMIIRSNKKALIFTMDCISSFEEQSKKGGAAGEGVRVNTVAQFLIYTPPCANN